MFVFPTRHVNNASSSPHYTVDDAASSLSPIPTAIAELGELGSNDNHVVWAPGKFFYMFFAFYLIQLTYVFHFLQVLNETTPGRRPLTGPWKHPQPTPRAVAHGVGTRPTTKRRENGNSATRPNGTTTRRRQIKRIKGPRDIKRCLGAVGKFFSLPLHYFVINRLF
jgi:hypothetical protein